MPHARFASPEPASPDSIDKIEAEPLQARIEHFKQNPSNMAVLHEFIEEVVQQAETAASEQQQEKSPEADKLQQGKEKRPSFAIPDFKNGKVVNRARGFVVRMFDAICNCANNNAAAATTRFKLRGSNAGGGAGGGGGGGGGANKRQQSQGSIGEPETLALSKKKTSATDQKKKKGVSMAEDVEAGVRLVD